MSILIDIGKQHKMLSEIIGQDHEEFVANNLHAIREKALNGQSSHCELLSTEVRPKK